MPKYFNRRLTRSRAIFRRLRFMKRKFMPPRLRRVSRMMARRRTRPELKFIEGNTTGTQLAAGRTYMKLNPTTMAQGTQKDQRIGNTVKFIMMNVRVSMALGYNPLGNIMDQVRVSIVSLRISSGEFVGYVSSMDWYDFWDHNCVTVHFDKVMFLTNQGATAAVLTGQPGTTGSVPAGKWFTLRIPFPRRVNFRDGDSDVNQDKAEMYAVVFNPNANAADLLYRFVTKLTFVDV